MLFGMTPNLMYTIFNFGLLSVCYDFNNSLFGYLPIPMEAMINTTLPRYGIPLTDLSLSVTDFFMTGVLNIGFVAAIFFFLPLSDSKGRLFTCVHLRSIFQIISSLLFICSAFFNSLELFLIGQVIFGVLGPLRLFSTPLLISECAPDKFRGFATFSLTLADSTASLIMSSLTSPEIFGNIDSWYIFPLASFILAVVAYIMAVRLKESPKWLVKQNEIEKAKQAVQFYQGNCNQDEVVHSMVRENDLTSSDKLSLKEVFGDDTLREAVKIVLVTYALSWLSPLAPDMNYSIPMHTRAGFTIDQTLLITLIFTILFSPGRLIGTFLVDTLGRRKIIFLASSLMILKVATSVFTFTISDVFGTSILTQTSMIITDLFTNLYHSTGTGSIGPLLISELFPPSARTTVGQLMIFLGLFAHLPIIFIFPIIQTYFTAAFYVPFLIIDPIILYYLYKNLPETKQRAVYDIIETMDNNVASRHESMMSESTPLIFRGRAKSFYVKRAVLRVTRKRSRTMDHLKRFKDEMVSQRIVRK